MITIIIVLAALLKGLMRPQRIIRVVVNLQVEIWLLNKVNISNVYKYDTSI